MLLNTEATTWLLKGPNCIFKIWFVGVCKLPIPLAPLFLLFSLRARADFSNALETERVGQRGRGRESHSHTHRNIYTHRAQHKRDLRSVDWTEDSHNEHKSKNPAERGPSRGSVRVWNIVKDWENFLITNIIKHGLISTLPKHFNNITYNEYWFGEMIIFNCL